MTQYITANDTEKEINTEGITSITTAAEGDEVYDATYSTMIQLGRTCQSEMIMQCNTIYSTIQYNTTLTT